MTEERTLVCHNCFEAATATGPRDRGDRRVALLRTDSMAYVFCSPECREWWFSVVGAEYYDHRETRIADGVSPAEVVSL